MIRPEDARCGMTVWTIRRTVSGDVVQGARLISFSHGNACITFQDTNMLDEPVDRIEFADLDTLYGAESSAVEAVERPWELRTE